MYSKVTIKRAEPVATPIESVKLTSEYGRKLVFSPSTYSPGELVFKFEDEANGLVSCKSVREFAQALIEFVNEQEAAHQ